MTILVDSSSTEIIVKNSRFLAELFPVENQADAREKLRLQKKKYEDASHVVHAFICGLSREVMGMSDDGEPSGTAGHPILDILKGHDCTNCMLTVTRWFGGTLLGTGGLVKAYGDSAKAVLAIADNKGSFEVYTAKSTFSFNTSYEYYDKIKRIFTSFSISDIKENFLQEISISGKIAKTDSLSFVKSIQELSNGKIKVQLE